MTEGLSEIVFQFLCYVFIRMQIMYRWCYIERGILKINFLRKILFFNI